MTDRLTWLLALAGVGAVNLAWWLAERWPAEWLPTLDRRRVGRARQDHGH